MNIAYIRHSLAAAVDMARFRDNPIDEFDHSYEGFFRSFIAMLLCAPLYPLILAGERLIVLEAAQQQAAGNVQELGMRAVTLTYCLVESGSYIAGWIVFPLVMIFIARLIGAGARYVPFIVAYNWGSCIVFALTAMLHLLHIARVLPLEAASFLYFPVTAFALIYRWWIAKLGLHVGGFTAAGIVILDVLLSVFIAFAFSTLQNSLV